MDVNRRSSRRGNVDQSAQHGDGLGEAMALLVAESPQVGVNGRTAIQSDLT